MSPAGKVQLKTFFKKEEREELSFPEFRAGTVLTAPKLDSSKPETFESQAKMEPLNSKSSKVLTNFSDQKFIKVVDSLNRASAILNSAKSSSGKAKPEHFVQARQELINLCAHVPIRDGLSNEYTRISKLPKPVLEHCCKTFRFSEKQKKRTSDESEDVPMTDEAPKRAKSQPKPVKAKVTKPAVPKEQKVKKPTTIAAASGNPVAKINVIRKPGPLAPGTDMYYCTAHKLDLPSDECHQCLW
jgi:hypothetical protein